MNIPDHFSFTISDPDQTDLVIVAVTDSRTGYTVRTALPQSGKQTASIMAFAGARFSRSSLTAEQLFSEIKQAGSNANEKLANIFKNYGHASVADMAQLFAYVENIPDHYSTIFFNESSVGGGQQRSTRYQDFSDCKPVSLKQLGVFDQEKDYNDVAQDFENLQSDAMAKYAKWADRLPGIYTEVYELEVSNKSHTAALTARVFDTARYFLPSGVCNKTSLAYITSAREWARLIASFKASHDQNQIYLGELIEIMFAPDADFAKEIGYLAEAPDLIRHTQGDTTTIDSLARLQEYLENQTDITNLFTKEQITFKSLSTILIDPYVSAGTKVILQYVLSIYPQLNISDTLLWLQTLSREKKNELSQLVFGNYTHHKQIGNQGKVNTHSFVLTCSNSEMRDFNRHRAWGRFVPILATNNYSQILASGYTLPLYVTENPKLAVIREEFEADLTDYYQTLQTFITKTEDLGWLPKHLWLELLPFAHIFTTIFHGSPKEISYLTQLRIRPGGHINYRVLAYGMAELASQSEPFLSALDLKQDCKPDPNSSKEFIDRS
jgi:thymidylate synthase ThyX